MHNTNKKHSNKKSIPKLLTNVFAIDGLSQVCWKEYRGTVSSILACFDQLIHAGQACFACLGELAPPTSKSSLLKQPELVSPEYISSFKFKSKIKISGLENDVLHLYTFFWDQRNGDLQAAILNQYLTQTPTNQSSNDGLNNPTTPNDANQGIELLSSGEWNCKGAHEITESSRSNMFNTSLLKNPIPTSSVGSVGSSILQPGRPGTVPTPLFVSHTSSALATSQSRVWSNLRKLLFKSLEQLLSLHLIKLSYVKVGEYLLLPQGDYESLANVLANFSFGNNPNNQQPNSTQYSSNQFKTSQNTTNGGLLALKFKFFVSGDATICFYTKLVRTVLHPIPHPQSSWCNSISSQLRSSHTLNETQPKIIVVTSPSGLTGVLTDPSELSREDSTFLTKSSRNYPQNTQKNHFEQILNRWKSTHFVHSESLLTVNIAGVNYQFPRSCVFLIFPPSCSAPSIIESDQSSSLIRSVPNSMNMNPSLAKPSLFSPIPTLNPHQLYHELYLQEFGSSSSIDMNSVAFIDNIEQWKPSAHARTIFALFSQHISFQNYKAKCALAQTSSFKKRRRNELNNSSDFNFDLDSLDTYPKKKFNNAVEEASNERRSSYEASGPSPMVNSLTDSMQREASNMMDQDYVGVQNADLVLSTLDNGTIPTDQDISISQASEIPDSPNLDEDDNAWNDWMEDVETTAKTTSIQKDSQMKSNHEEFLHGQKSIPDSSGLSTLDSQSSYNIPDIHFTPGAPDMLTGHQNMDESMVSSLTDDHSLCVPHSGVSSAYDMNGQPIDDLGAHIDHVDDETCSESSHLSLSDEEAAIQSIEWQNKAPSNSFHFLDDVCPQIYQPLDKTRSIIPEQLLMSQKSILGLDKSQTPTSTSSQPLSVHSQYLYQSNQSVDPSTSKIDGINSDGMNISDESDSDSDDSETATIRTENGQLTNSFAPNIAPSYTSTGYSTAHPHSPFIRPSQITPSNQFLSFEPVVAASNAHHKAHAMLSSKPNPFLMSPSTPKPLFNVSQTAPSALFASLSLSQSDHTHHHHNSSSPSPLLSYTQRDFALTAWKRMAEFASDDSSTLSLAVQLYNYFEASTGALLSNFLPIIYNSEVCFNPQTSQLLNLSNTSSTATGVHHHAQLPGHHHNISRTDAIACLNTSALDTDPQSSSLLEILEKEALNINSPLQGFSDFTERQLTDTSVDVFKVYHRLDYIRSQLWRSDMAGASMPNTPAGVSTLAFTPSSLSSSDEIFAAEWASLFGTIFGPISTEDWIVGRNVNQDLSNKKTPVSGKWCGSLESSLGNDFNWPSAHSISFSDERFILNQLEHQVFKSNDQQQIFGAGTSIVGPLPLINFQRKLSGNLPTTDNNGDQMDISDNAHTKDLECEVLVDPVAVVRYGEESSLELPPTALYAWEKLNLRPFSPKKDVTYFAIVPSDLGASAKHFFKQLSAIYSQCNLGTHSADSPLVEANGVIPVSVPTGLEEYEQRLNETIDPSLQKDISQQFKAFWGATASSHATSSLPFPLITPYSITHNQLKAYEECAQKISERLSQSRQYNRSIVVYVVNPFTFENVIPASAGDCNSLHQHDPLGGLGATREQQVLAQRSAATLLGAVLSSVRKSNARNLVVHGVSMNRISNSIIHQTQLKEIAFNVYTKCRRVLLGEVTSNATSEREAPKLYEPLFIVSKPAPSTDPNEIMSSSVNPLSKKKEDSNILHVSYVVNCKTLTWCMSDCRGEILECSALPAFRTLPLALPKLLLKIAQSLPPCSSEKWKVVIGKMGQITADELVEWKQAIKDLPSLPKTNSHRISCIVLLSYHPSCHLNIIPENIFPIVAEVPLNASTSVSANQIHAAEKYSTSQFGNLDNSPGASHPHEPSKSIAIYDTKPSSDSWDNLVLAKSFVFQYNPQWPHASLWAKNQSDIMNLLIHQVYLAESGASEQGSIQGHNAQRNPSSRLGALSFEPTTDPAIVQTILRDTTRQYHQLSWLNLSPMGIGRVDSIPLHYRVLRKLAMLHLSQSSQ